MSWDQIFGWAISTVQSQAKKAAVAEIQNLANQLNKAIAHHAPDASDAVQKKLSDVAAHAISGLLTRKS